MDSDEWDEWEGDEGIPPTDCLFCKHKNSSSLEENMKHMTEAHFFFIPDIEFCVDFLGLITYLGEKVKFNPSPFLLC